MAVSCKTKIAMANMILVGMTSILVCMLCGCMGPPIIQGGASTTTTTTVPMDPKWSSISKKEKEKILHLVDEKWSECEGSVQASTPKEMENIGAKYKMGSPVMEWGCSCVGTNPTLWLDLSTKYMYVVEDVTENLCEASPDEISGVVRRLDPATTVVNCLGWQGGADQCMDLRGSLAHGVDKIQGLLPLLGMETGSMSLVSEMAVPLLTAIINNITLPGMMGEWVDAVNSNFCLGEWTGEEILSNHKKNGEELYINGCTYPSYVKTKSYSVLSMRMDMKLLKKIGMCGTVDDDDNVYFCAAYTGCTDLLAPTFALTISSSMATCFLDFNKEKEEQSDDGVGLAPKTVTNILEQAIKWGLTNIAFGLSLTGDWQQTVPAYDGSKKDVKMRGNIFAYVRFDTAEFFPKAISNFIGFIAGLYATVQVYDGTDSSSVTQAMMDVYSAEDPMEYAKTELTKVTVAGQGRLHFIIYMDRLTNGLLDDLELGDILKASAVLTKQRHTQSGLEPGYYLYLNTGDSVVARVVDWAFKWFGDKVIDPIAPDGVSDTLRDMAVNGANALTRGDLAFGFFHNTNSIGFLVTFPISIGIVGLGKLTLSCKIKMTTIEVSCGIGYDEPKWLAAVWDGVVFIAGKIGKGVELLANAVGLDLDGAEEAAEQFMKDAGKTVEQIGGAVSRMRIPAKAGAEKVVQWTKDTGKFFSDAGEGLKNLGEDIGKGFADFGGKAGDTAIDIITAPAPIVNEIGDWFKKPKIFR